MFLEEFRNVLSAQPFRPFVIHVADGRSLSVASREFVARDPTGRTVAVYQPDGRRSILDLLLVTELELQTNGRTRAKRKR